MLGVKLFMIQKLYKSNILNRLRSLKDEYGYKLYDLKRTLTQKHALELIINEKELRVIGLRRTGNHGIMNWIKYQHDDKVFHLNNIKALKNPYRQRYSWDKKDFWRQEALGNFTKKSFLIYSYEDYSLEQITNPDFEKKHDLYFGKSGTRYDVLILRDPFNFIASRLKRNYIDVKAPKQTFVSLWIECAKEFLNETNYLKNNKVCVNYNRWFCEIDYRKHISSLLGLEFSDAGLNVIQGGGSSFNVREFHGKANQMDVLSRWQNYRENNDYLKLVENQEMLEYSKKIFGIIPGTDFLYKT